MGEPLTERSFAVHALRWLDDEKNYPTELAKAIRVRGMGHAFERGRGAIQARDSVPAAA